MPRFKRLALKPQYPPVNGKLFCSQCKSSCRSKSQECCQGLNCGGKPFDPRRLWSAQSAVILYFHPNTCVCKYSKNESASALVCDSYKGDKLVYFKHRMRLKYDVVISRLPVVSSAYAAIPGDYTSNFGILTCFLTGWLVFLVFFARYVIGCDSVRIFWRQRIVVTKWVIEIGDMVL